MHPLLTATCIQTIRLEDKTGPVLTVCPSDITINLKQIVLQASHGILQLQQMLVEMLH